MVHERDPVRLADANWRAHGWDTGEHFAASLSLYRTDDLIRLFDEAALRPHGLTRSRHEALALLYFSRHGEMALGRLGQRLLVHPTSVTSTVDALERLGHVRRVAHPADRRATLAQITAKGRRAIEASIGIMAADGCGLAELTERQASDLFALLAKVRADAGDIKRADGEDDGEGDPVLAADDHWRVHGWDTGPYFRAALSVYRTVELIRLTNEAALRPHRLTHTRHEALAVLYFSRQGEMPLGRLSTHLLVHPTSVTTTVDTLERLGLARRVPHPTDRRATLARITPKGRRAIESSNTAMLETRFGLAALSDRQAKRVFNLLVPVRLSTRPGTLSLTSPVH